MDSEYMKVPKIEIAIYPDSNRSCSMVEPYNSVLSSSTLDEVSSFSIMMDNEALTDICVQRLDIERPAYPNINRIVAQACSGLTASMRHEGPLTASLPQLQTNLVPFPRLHYLQIGVSPMSTQEVVTHECVSTLEMTLNVFDTLNQLLLGDPKKTCIMTTALLYRGDISCKEISYSIEEMKRRGMLGMVDWCPTGFKVIIHASY